MSELKTALQAILQVNFKEHVPANDAAKIADFLERAAIELHQRVEAVELREQAVSGREAKVSLREEETTAQIKTIRTLGRVSQAMEIRPKRRLWGVK